MLACYVAVLHSYICPSHAPLWQRQAGGGYCGLVIVVWMSGTCSRQVQDEYMSPAPCACTLQLCTTYSSTGALSKVHNLCCPVAVLTLAPTYSRFPPETTVVGHTVLTWLYTSFASSAHPPPSPPSSYPHVGMWFDMIGRGGGP